jgi:DNA-binding transcriptional LysR family regulator
MTLDQLKIFIAVAERGHLTQAANVLALTPSAVSASIKVLEERYGTTLFNRVGRGIELSEAGKSFLPEARATLASAQATETTLAELGNGKRGRLSMQASQTMASYWLPPLLVQFRQAHPLIELSLAIGNTQSVARAVTNGSSEIGFVEGATGEPGLQAAVVGTDRFIAVVAPGHPWAGGQPVAPMELLDGLWVMREIGSGTRSAFEAMLAGIGIDSGALDIALTLPSNESVRSAVMAGPFVTAVSALAVAAHLQAGLLREVNIALPTRPFYLLRHPARHQSRAALALEQLITASATASAPPSTTPADGQDASDARVFSRLQVRS